MIAELAIAGLTKLQAYSELRPMVADQIEPMVFKANVGGHRVPKHMGEQLIELKNEIGRVYAELLLSESKDFDSEEIPQEETVEEDEEEQPKPQAKGKRKVRDEIAYFVRRVQEIRAFCERRQEMDSYVDSIGLRPIEHGSKLIPAGVPADACLSAMCLNWSEETRQDADVPTFDFQSFSLQEMETRGLVTDARGNDFHSMFGYAVKLAESRVPIFCVGPHGTGKSHLGRQLAEHLFGDDPAFYAETPMTPGASRGDLLGRLTPAGFIPSNFTEVYAGGGVFNFEELDASAEDMLIVLNNALAGPQFFNSMNATRYVKHENFVAYATGNTWGTGATKEYAGRSRLDAASLDRFRMGRILVKLDPRVELKMAYAHVGNN